MPRRISQERIETQPRQCERLSLSSDEISRLKYPLPYAINLRLWRSGKSTNPDTYLSGNYDRRLRVTRLVSQSLKTGRYDIAGIIRSYWSAGSGVIQAEAFYRRQQNAEYARLRDAGIDIETALKMIE